MDGLIYGLPVVCALVAFLIVSMTARVRAARTQKQIIKSIE